MHSFKNSLCSHCHGIKQALLCIVLEIGCTTIVMVVNQVGVITPVLLVSVHVALCEIVTHGSVRRRITVRFCLILTGTVTFAWLLNKLLELTSYCNFLTCSYKKHNSITFGYIITQLE